MCARSFVLLFALNFFVKLLVLLLTRATDLKLTRFTFCLIVACVLFGLLAHEPVRFLSRLR